MGITKTLRLHETGEKFLMDLVNTSKGQNFEVSRYLLYLIVRKIKETHFTYSPIKSDSFNVLQPFFLEQDLKIPPFEFCTEEITKQYMQVAEGINDLDGLYDFLSSYLLLINRNEMSELHKEANDYIEMLNILSNSRTEWIVQTPFVRDNLHYEAMLDDFLNSFSKMLGSNNMEFYQINFKNKNVISEGVVAKLFYYIDIKDEHISFYEDFKNDLYNVDCHINCIENAISEFMKNQEYTFVIKNYPDNKGIRSGFCNLRFSKILPNNDYEELNEFLAANHIKFDRRTNFLDKTKKFNSHLFFNVELDLSMNSFLSLIEKIKTND